ncbi:MAG: prolipoprotein diacylglyceryl transferase [Oscillospiraceae bacterium]|jgi:hypothetical protein|nr:prolipoprotein diacylglyceryl transferase [Oscillospiraceae bacterium]
MLDWFYEHARVSHHVTEDELRFVAYLAFLVLIYFVQRSAKFNARAELVYPDSTTIFRKFARTATKNARRRFAKENYVRESIGYLAPPLSPRSFDFLHKFGIPKFLDKLEENVYTKWRLQPDVHNERRISFFWLCFTATTYVVMHKILRESVFDPSIILIRMTGDDGIKLLTNFFIYTLYCILLFVPFFLIRKNREFVFDMATIYFLLYIAIDKLIVCWNTGCCLGIPWEHGIYNERVHTEVFPVQLLESFVGFACVALLLLYMRNAKSYRPGRVCTLSCFGYAVPRFFWEYLRYTDVGYRASEANVYFGLSAVQLLCLALVLLGIVWWLLLPIEKKLMDKFVLFISSCVRWFAGKVPALQKWADWSESVAALEDLTVR